MKKYESPELHVDEFAPDTMIASGEGGGGPKNDNAGNNQNCWSYNCVPGAVEDGETPASVTVFHRVADAKCCLLSEVLKPNFVDPIC